MDYTEFECSSMSLHHAQVLIVETLFSKNVMSENDRNEKKTRKLKNFLAIDPNQSAVSGIDSGWWNRKFGT